MQTPLLAGLATNQKSPAANHLRSVVAGLCLSLLHFTDASCADVNLTKVTKDSAQRPTFHLSLTGDIVSGDLSRLETVIEKIHKSQNSDGYIQGKFALHLSSPGGSFQEGLKIARYIQTEAVRSDGIGTFIDSGSVCDSACGLIFLAGVEHEGDNILLPDRTLSPNGQLRLHSPLLNIEIDNPPRDIIETSYRAAVKDIAELIALSPQLHLKENLLPTILAKVGATEFLAIDTVAKLGAFGVKLQVTSPKRYSPEMLYNLCDHAERMKDRFLVNTDHFDPTTIDADFPVAPIMDDEPSYLAIKRGSFPAQQYQYRSASGSTSAQLTRYIVAKGDGMDGSKFCVVDFESLDGSQPAPCVSGFVTIDTPGDMFAEVWRRMKSFQPTSSRVCGSSSTFALAPADTPHSEVQRVIELYERRSGAISAEITNRQAPANSSKLSPAPLTSAQTAVAPSKASLIETLSASKWTINSSNSCTDPVKVYSLNHSENRLTWNGGTGSVNEETIRFADSSTLVTATTRSTSGTAPGTNWTYKRLPNGTIRVSTSGKKDFTLVACSIERNRSSENSKGTVRPAQSRDRISTSGLLKIWSSLNERCRGGVGNSPATDNACKQRDKFSLELKKVGCVHKVGDKWTCN